MKKIKLFIFTVVMTTIFVACGNDNQHHEMNHDSNMQKDHNHEMKAADEMHNEMVREGVIDVESLDANGDGKIYECPMDWNVLTDSAGSCPVCGMNLKEYTITGVKENLDKYGYEYKK